MTNDHAAGRSNIGRTGLLGLVALLALGLAGCETTTGLFGSAGDSSTTTPIAQSAPAQPTVRARVALAPVIGAPEAVARQISQQLATSLEQRQIAVAKPGEASDFTIRGYLVAAKEKSSTKVSYIWDVNDPAGKRINRVTGEEAAASNADRDPWTAVTPQTVQAIADRTASNLATSLPAGQQPVAVAGALQTAGSGQSGLQRTASTTTASIGQTGGLLAVVPAVSGAPGDGSQALAVAMQKELTRNGIQLAQGPTAASAYRVEGKVQVGQGKAGVQPIQIEWQVKDPRGTKLGTVSQKNDIPQGSLDGTWGQTAEIAAAAAAQGVIKLLPQTQTN